MNSPTLAALEKQTSLEVRHDVMDFESIYFTNKEPYLTATVKPKKFLDIYVQRP